MKAVRELKRKKKQRKVRDQAFPRIRSISPASNQSSKGRDSLCDEDLSGTDSEEARRVMNMNVGQRRQYEANKKKEKENSEKFALLFKGIVKNHLINQDPELQVLDLTDNYEEHVSSIQTKMSLKKFYKKIEVDLMESRL